MEDSSTCRNCHTPLDTYRIKKRAHFCKLECRKEFEVRTYRAANPLSSIATATTGAMSELLVCADLLKRGFAVFRAVSPACPCDVAIIAKGKLYRIEVKTAYFNRSGSIGYGMQKSHRADPGERFDILAMCIKGSGEIHYKPDLDELFAVSIDHQISQDQFGPYIRVGYPE